MNPSHVVAVRPCRTYEIDAVRRAVRECLSLADGAADCFRAGTSVLLKPNVVSPRSPDRPVCTHPAIVRAVAEVAVEAGCRVLVADQPTFVFAERGDDALTPTGYADALRGLPVEVRLLGHDGYEPVAVPNAFRLPTVHVSRMFRSADAVVNLAKCKTHTQTTLTLALKNLFGAVAPRDRLRVHGFGQYAAVAEALADCCSATVPQLNLMDAIVGMEGPGPTQGPAREIGVVAAAVNAVAMDLVIEDLVGMRGEVGVTQAAARAALGPKSLEEVAVVGAEPHDLRVPFKRPPVLGRSFPALFGHLGERLLYVRPRIDAGRCIACGGCAKACPVGAVNVRGHAVIDRAICVECFCCMEACPVDAISVQRSLLARLAIR